MKFWQTKSLAEMNDAEWESLCDGCARCCMVKLEDEHSGEVAYSAVVCDLLQMPACRCGDYSKRHERVPDCVVLNPQTLKTFDWLPKSCAYRALAEGRDLEWWHPLVSGDPQTVHEAGISVRGKVLHESMVHADDLEEMIVKWVET